MDTQMIKIDEATYEVPAAVVKRMGEYYDSCTEATNAYNNLHAKTEKMVELIVKVRRLQKEWFKNKVPDILRASKAAEKELDELLEGKTKQEQVIEQQLWR